MLVEDQLLGGDTGYLMLVGGKLKSHSVAEMLADYRNLLFDELSKKNK